MKFLVSMAEADHYAKWDASSDAEQQAVFDCFNAFLSAIRERGEVHAGEPLGHPDTARTLRPGQPRTLTEGPYAETVEQTGGFYVVDSPDMAAVLTAADLLPAAYTIEVRPIPDVGPTT